jgi:hypothetical protein
MFKKYPSLIVTILALFALIIYELVQLDKNIDVNWTSGCVTIVGIIAFEVVCIVRRKVKDNKQR